MTIRRAVPADASGIAHVSVRAWRAVYRGLIPDDYLDALSVRERGAAWRDYLRRELDGYRTWVLESEGRVLGFTRTGPAADGDAEAATGQVYGLYVDPELIGAGLGRVLFRHALDDLRRRGFREATLWTFEGNRRAARFYERAGCRRDGTRRRDRTRPYDVGEERWRIALERGPTPVRPIAAVLRQA